jgi:hypothetical protein
LIVTTAICSLSDPKITPRTLRRGKLDAIFSAHSNRAALLHLRAHDCLYDFRATRDFESLRANGHTTTRLRLGIGHNDHIGIARERWPARRLRTSWKADLWRSMGRGKFLFVLNPVSDSISMYQINGSNGALTEVPGSCELFDQRAIHAVSRGLGAGHTADYRQCRGEPAECGAHRDRNCGSFQRDFDAGERRFWNGGGRGERRDENYSGDKFGNKRVARSRDCAERFESRDFSQSNTCAGNAVAAQGSCSITVNFVPQSAGQRSASIVVTDDAANSPQSIAVAGDMVAAFQLTAAPVGSTNATVSAGLTANYALQLMPGPGYTGNVSMSYSGAPLGAACNVVPATMMVSSGNAVPFEVIVTTSGNVLALPPGGITPKILKWSDRVEWLIGGWMLGCMILVKMQRERRLISQLLCAGVLLGAVAMTVAGCGEAWHRIR